MKISYFNSIVWSIAQELLCGKLTLVIELWLVECVGKIHCNRMFKWTVCYLQITEFTYGTCVASRPLLYSRAILALWIVSTGIQFCPACWPVSLMMQRFAYGHRNRTIPTLQVINDLTLCLVLWSRSTTCTVRWLKSLKFRISHSKNSSSKRCVVADIHWRVGFTLW